MDVLLGGLQPLFAPASVLWGAPVTWLEVLAFVLALATVVMNIRVNPIGWPLAITSSLLYFGLFWSSLLYGDAGLQIFFGRRGLGMAVAARLRADDRRLKCAASRPQALDRARRSRSHGRRPASSSGPSPTPTCGGMRFRPRPALSVSGCSAVHRTGRPG
jgi:hypothetical protein